MKRVKLFVLLLRLFWAVAGMLTSCSEATTCPTYSSVYNTQSYHRSYNKVKNQPNYYKVHKFKY